MTGEAIVNDDLGYPIVVGEELKRTLAAFARKHDPPSVVLCDANRHVRALASDVAGALGSPKVLAFPLGERRKRLATVEHVLDAMKAAGVERTGLVVGVGGGVASDLFGFAGAIYMRGVGYAHVATSLVAMVDAAIGGKTAVDLRAERISRGAFATRLLFFATPPRSPRCPFAVCAKDWRRSSKRRSSRAATFSMHWKSLRRIRSRAGRGRA